MRKLIAAAGVAIFTAGAAQAAVVDLTYTVEAVVTSVQKFDFRDVKVGELPREVGDVENFVFSILADTDTGFCQSQYSNPCNTDTGAGIFYWSDADSSISYNLTAGGSTIEALFPIGVGPVDTNPRGYGLNGQPFDQDAFENLTYDVLEWSVDGIPAPVPLPASGLLLLAGIGGLGWLKRPRPSQTAR